MFRASSVIAITPCRIYTGKYRELCRSFTYLLPILSVANRQSIPSPGWIWYVFHNFENCFTQPWWCWSAITEILLSGNIQAHADELFRARRMQVLTSKVPIRQPATSVDSSQKLWFAYAAAVEPICTGGYGGMTQTETTMKMYPQDWRIDDNEQPLSLTDLQTDLTQW